MLTSQYLRADTVTIAHSSPPCVITWDFTGFADPVLNDAGQVAFLAGLAAPNMNTDTVIYRGDGGCLIELAKEGSPIPAETTGEYGFYDDLFAPATRPQLAINGAGHVAFWTRVKAIPLPQDPEGDAIILFDGAEASLIARTSQAPPDGNGAYDSFFPFVGLTEDAGVIFQARIAGIDPQSSGNAGVFFSHISTGTGPREVSRFVRVGDLVSPASSPIDLFYGNAITNFNDAGHITHMAALAEPDGRNVVYFASGAAGPGLPTKDFRAGDFANWDFSGLQMMGMRFDPAVNNLGDVAFTAGVIGGSFSTSPSAIFRNRTSSFATKIAITDDPSPDGNGVLRDFFRPRINDRVQVAFAATFWNTDQFPDDDSAVILTLGDVPGIIAREGEPAPRAGTRYGDLADTPIALNHAGQVVFQADIVGDVTGRGIFMSDGTETIVVAHTGDTLENQTITDLEFTGGASRQRTGLNAFGQVAYRAAIDNGDEVVALTTPEVHWRRDPNGGGPGLQDWNHHANWTAGIQPGDVHDVYLDYASPVTTISGPQQNVTVKSLTIGDGANRVALTLHTGATLEALNGIMFAAANSLSVEVSGGAAPQNGRLTAGGSIALSGSLNFNAVGVEPLAGQSFELISSDAGAISGVLSYSGPHLVEQTATNVSVTYLPVPGDRSAMAAFTQCLAGPGAPIDTPNWLSLDGCLAAFDSDGDDDIDLVDYVSLEQLITEP